MFFRKTFNKIKEKGFIKSNGEDDFEKYLIKHRTLKLQKNNEAKRKNEKFPRNKKGFKE